MKEILFVMQLVFPGGAMPPYREPMPSLEACQEKVAKAMADFKDTDETFSFTAGCVLRSAKANPA